MALATESINSSLNSDFWGLQVTISLKLPTRSSLGSLTTRHQLCQGLFVLRNYLQRKMTTLPNYNKDPTISITENFRRLAIQEGWTKKSKSY